MQRTLERKCDEDEEVFKMMGTSVKTRAVAISILLLLLASCILPQRCAYAAELETAQSQTPRGAPAGPLEEDQQKEETRNGWYREKGCKKYYIDGQTATGSVKIGKSYYYFDAEGVLQSGTVRAGKTTYYLTDKGIVEAYKTGKVYFYANGKKMGKVAKNDFVTLQRAKKIAAKITKPKMSKKEKLETCFKWVIKKHYRMRRPFKNKKGWPAVYANDHFKGGGGDCHSDAAAFGYLAKAIGYKNVYICCDSKEDKRGHSWTEINGRVYDPLFAEAKSYKNHYGVKYGVYRLHPVLRVKI